MESKQAAAQCGCAVADALLREKLTQHILAAAGDGWQVTVD